MATVDTTQSKDADLERTDRLPVLEGVIVDQEVEDDAVRLEYTAILQTPVRPSQIPLSDDSGFARAAVEVASRTESVRPAKERTARQSAEYGAVSRLYEKAREAEAASAARAEALLAELSAARAALVAEQYRAREMERDLAERDALEDAARALAAGAPGAGAGAGTAAEASAERVIAVRDAAIAQLQHSLAERDAQLNALQREHAKTVPALEAQLSGHVETGVNTERSRAEELAAELKTMQQSRAAVLAQLKEADAELRATRGELSSVKRQAEAYLESLRTREFRRGFDENLFREWDARLSEAAPVNPQAAQERSSPEPPTELLARLDDLEADRNRLQGELAARDRALAEAAQIHEDELTVLMAHLNEARRPIQTILADVERLTDELALKTSTIDELNQDNRSLRAALERTRGALEEREFLIRRLERSESADANALGRQPSIEWLGNAPPTSAAGALAADCSAELIRIDGERHIVYPVARRTRIGRAPACELQLDSTSVSRHHALLLKSARELIIEDLNSTNGVLVNGRKISRQLLKDGDLLTLGEVQLRCSLKSVPPPPRAPRS